MDLRCLRPYLANIRQALFMRPDTKRVDLPHSPSHNAADHVPRSIAFPISVGWFMQCMSFVHLPQLVRQYALQPIVTVVTYPSLWQGLALFSHPFGVL